MAFPTFVAVAVALLLCANGGVAGGNLFQRKSKPGRTGHGRRPRPQSTREGLP